MKKNKLRNEYLQYNKIIREKKRGKNLKKEGCKSWRLFVVW